MNDTERPRFAAEMTARSVSSASLRAPAHRPGPPPASRSPARPMITGVTPIARKAGEEAEADGCGDQHPGPLRPFDGLSSPLGAHRLGESGDRLRGRSPGRTRPVQTASQRGLPGIAANRPHASAGSPPRRISAAVRASPSPTGPPIDTPTSSAASPGSFRPRCRRPTGLLPAAAGCTITERSGPMPSGRRRSRVRCHRHVPNAATEPTAQPSKPLKPESTRPARLRPEPPTAVPTRQAMSPQVAVPVRTTVSGSTLRAAPPQSSPAAETLGRGPLSSDIRPWPRLSAERPGGKPQKLSPGCGQLLGPPHSCRLPSTHDAAGPVQPGRLQ